MSFIMPAGSQHNQACPAGASRVNIRPWNQSLALLHASLLKIAPWNILAAHGVSIFHMCHSGFRFRSRFRLARFRLITVLTVPLRFRDRLLFRRPTQFECHLIFGSGQYTCGPNTSSSLKLIVPDAQALLVCQVYT